ncbi:MAG: class I SAM-dependent methyltransferase [Ktedonobacteraceae bacterium]
MNPASYDNIAEWYDAYLRENPIYQDILLPHLLALVGDIQGQNICDLACGQGWIARELARRGATVTGIDLSENLLEMARRYEEQEPTGIVYLQGDAQSDQILSSNSFDGVICAMALMLFPDLAAAFQAARRILKPGGWLVFAITHPCFETPHSRWMTSDKGSVARVVRGYFNETFWTSTSQHGVRSRVGEHHRMLSTYLNTLVASGFTLERIVEPNASGERARQAPGNLEVPSLLLVRAQATAS